MGWPGGMNFVAIDFETANSSRSSACSVAVVTVQNSQVTGSFYSLVRPADLKFDYWNTKIHGITADDVRHQPDFAQLWPRLKPYLQQQTVIAHNAAFDFSVLRSVLNVYGLETPSFKHFCTVSMAKRVWPNCENYRLSTLARAFAIDFEHHHALHDARVCAMLALLAKDEVRVDNLEQLIAKLKMRVQTFRAC
ncbi:DNA polymerase-3 subunit epsilon [Dendrosporobacter quercicolus]|uniref:DNA polymerase-3 subunit epsilon n=2 Tax=Dendrosporobacter quercicolus TaxID=146817 RepID=A0A1G9N565_9FIRM|nr:DNA polymerase-3 subunit epsilon [Dendrosporobacter quercicolus]